VREVVLLVRRSRCARQSALAALVLRHGVAPTVGSSQPRKRRYRQGAVGYVSASVSNVYAKRCSRRDAEKKECGGIRQAAAQPCQEKVKMSFRLRACRQPHDPLNPQLKVASSGSRR